jgi:hypothetical protein
VVPGLAVGLVWKTQLIWSCEAFAEGIPCVGTPPVVSMSGYRYVIRRSQLSTNDIA